MPNNKHTGIEKVDFCSIRSMSPFMCLKKFGSKFQQKIYQFKDRCKWLYLVEYEILN